MNDYKNEQLKKYSGVKGWLLLFCLVLTIFSPLAIFYISATSYKEFASVFSMFPSLEKWFYIDGLLNLVLMGLSIRAGIALWTVKPGAVKTAKNYLLIFLAYTGISVLLPFMAGLPTEVNDAMAPAIIESVFHALIFFGVWYSYLNKSKRVKATYNSNITSEEFESIFVEKYR